MYIPDKATKAQIGILDTVLEVQTPNILLICPRHLICRIGTAKFFTLLLLLYHTSVKSQGIKQLMAGGGIALVGATLIPLLSGLFG